MHPSTAQGGVDATPPRVWPLIELEPRDKNERVGRHETKRLVPFFKVLGHLVTVTSQKVTFEPKSFWLIAFYLKKDADLGVAPSSFSRRDASNDVLVDLERST